MDLDLGEGTQLVVWLGWEHNPLVQLGWMRGTLKAFQMHTMSSQLLGNRTDLKGHLVDQRYIGIHLCGVSSNLNRCTPPPLVHRQ